jgi:hypothetical protein
MVRESFLDLRDNFRRIVDPAITAKRKGALILLHLWMLFLAMTLFDVVSYRTFHSFIVQ